MQAGLRTALTIGAGIVGAGVIGYGLWSIKRDADVDRATITSFDDIGKDYLDRFDADGDGRIDRATEAVRFSGPSLKYGATYASIRVAADAADMVHGDRDGFADAAEFAKLAASYTSREGATGLDQRERSVFYEDYGTRLGDGGSPSEMRGNSYL